MSNSSCNKRCRRVNCLNSGGSNMNVSNNDSSLSLSLSLSSSSFSNQRFRYHRRYEFAHQNVPILFQLVSIALIMIVRYCCLSIICYSSGSSGSFGSSGIGIINVVHANTFNPQVMIRVIEHFNNFLQIPSQATNRILKLRTVHGFPYNMKSPDRTFVFQILAMESPLNMYYGLEDGTFMGFGKNRNNSYYREPGNSGYRIRTTTINNNGTSTTGTTSSTSSDMDTQYTDLYYKSCINETNGNVMNCTLTEGVQYIECINNDCTDLIPCPDDESQRNCTSISIRNNNDEKFKRQTCETSKKWCSNYVIKEVPAQTQTNTNTNNNNNSNVLLGYIPRTEYCINTLGQQEQRIGHVLINAQTMELGNCYYGDGKTIVNRSMIGSYMDCGYSSTTVNTDSDTDDVDDDDRSTNKNKLCNTTFIGGKKSTSYDPRVRDWYIQTKQQQQSLWSDPYVFFESQQVGITYTSPIHSIIPNGDYDNIIIDKDTTSTNNGSNNYNNNNNTKMIVFDGVLAVDYYLDQIAVFLKDAFYDSEMMVVAVEEAEPHYVIASSHGSIPTRTVLKSDLTVPCPSNSSSNNNICTAVRTTIYEYNTTRNDAIVQRAFIAQQEMNFPKSSLVSFKETPTSIGSKAYISQSDLYTQSDGSNLRWHILVVMPMYRPESDVSNPGDLSFLAICILSAIGCIGCFWMFYILYTKRMERAVIHADWRFTCAFLAGCSGLNLSSLALLGEHTNSTCLVRMWLFNILFSCALSPLFVKVWRMYKLLDASSSFQRVNVTNVQAFVRTIPIVAVQAFILTMFTIFDRPVPVETLTVSNGIGVQNIACAQSTNAFFICQLTFDGLLVAIGCVLAYKTRNLHPKFGEAKQLAFSMYNIAFTGIMIVMIIQMVELDEASKIVLQTVGVLWGTLFSSLAFVLPRLLEVADDRKSKSFMNSGSSFSAISGLSIIDETTSKLNFASGSQTSTSKNVRFSFPNDPALADSSDSSAAFTLDKGVIIETPKSQPIENATNEIPSDHSDSVIAIDVEYARFTFDGKDETSNTSNDESKGTAVSNTSIINENNNCVDNGTKIAMVDSFLTSTVDTTIVHMNDTIQVGNEEPSVPPDDIVDDTNVTLVDDRKSAFVNCSDGIPPVLPPNKIIDIDTNNLMKRLGGNSTHSQTTSLNV